MSDAKADQYYDCISEQGSERATSSFGNRIVSVSGKVHVVWQDAREPSPTSGIEDAFYKKPYSDYPARVRTLDVASGTWSPTVTIGLGRDNHARPTIVADRSGHLHVIIGGHHTPMQHFRSIAPNDSSGWELVEEFGQNTYPVVVVGPDDTFYLFARHDSGWQGTDFYVRRDGGRWEPQGLLVKREPQHVGYCAFACGMVVGSDGTLHYVSDFYEGSGLRDQRGFKQAVAAMRSLDGGRSWQKADGTPVEIPARPEDMDTLEIYRGNSHEPMALVVSHGCIGVTSRGKPCVFYVSHLREPGEMILASPDDAGVWEKRFVSPSVTGFPDHRPKGDCRGRFVMTADDRMHIILTLYPVDRPGWQNGRPAEELKFVDSQVPLVKLTSSDFGVTWSSRRLESPYDGGLIQELNMERNDVNWPLRGRDPYSIFFDGLSRYPKRDEVINTRVYFAR